MSCVCITEHLQQFASELWRSSSIFNVSKKASGIKNGSLERFMELCCNRFWVYQNMTIPEFHSYGGLRSTMIETAPSSIIPMFSKMIIPRLVKPDGNESISESDRVCECFICTY